jgi:hypothetical protein
MNFSINASMGGIHKQLEISQPKTISFSKNTEKRVIDNHLQLLSCGRTFKQLQAKLRHFAAKTDNQNVNSQEDEIAVDYVRLALFVTAFAAVLSGFVFGIAGLAIGAIVCGGGIVFGGRSSHSGSSSGLSPPDKDTAPRFTNKVSYKLKIAGLFCIGFLTFNACSDKDDPTVALKKEYALMQKDSANMANEIKYLTDVKMLDVNFTEAGDINAKIRAKLWGLMVRGPPFPETFADSVAGKNPNSQQLGYVVAAKAFVDSYKNELSNEGIEYANELGAASKVFLDFLPVIAAQRAAKTN